MASRFRTTLANDGCSCYGRALLPRNLSIASRVLPHVLPHTDSHISRVLRHVLPDFSTPTLMLRRTEVPVEIETNYAGFARELSGILSSSAISLLQTQEKCRAVMQAQYMQPETVSAHSPAEMAVSIREFEEQAFASLENAPPSLKGKPPAACPESPVSRPSRRRPGQSWAWEA